MLIAKSETMRYLKPWQAGVYFGSQLLALVLFGFALWRRARVEGVTWK